MRRLIIERLGHLLLVLWVIATLTFLLFRLMPGDPTLNFLSPTFTDEMRVSLLKGFGLDKPMWEQYLLYMGNLLRGDFGRSFLQNAPVSAILWDALPNTIILTFVSLCIAYAFGIVAGAFLAFRRGGAVEAVAIPTALGARGRHRISWPRHAGAGAVRIPAWLVSDRWRGQSWCHDWFAGAASGVW